MKTSIYALAAAAALVATPAAFASGADAPASVPAAIAAPGAHFTLVDNQSSVVGELISESATSLRLRVIGVTNAARSAAAPTDQRADRTFHPDYSKALTTGQLGVALQAELDRLFPQPVTGGG